MAKKTHAIAYLRTSSAANVGADRDNDKHGTQDVSLDFAFQIVDGDRDTTAVQHLNVDLLNV